MADVSKTVAIIFQGVDNASPAIASIEGSLKGISTAAGSAAPNLDAAAVSSNKLGASAVSVGELTRAMQALAGSVVFKEFIDANVAIENFGRSMTLVSGSTQGAADALTYVRTTADTLGLEISGTANNFVALSAAAKGTALEGQGTRDIFEAVSKAMALLGKSTADTQGALLAVQQIISKGTVSSEELRGQLGERLPGAFQIAARSVGVTTAELGKLLEGGKVLAEDFLPKFAAELNKTFGDTTYVTTFNAELNRLINSFKDLAVAGGDAGLFAAITTALVDVTKGAKNTATEIEVITKTFSALKTFLADGGTDVEGFSRALQTIKINAGIAGSEIAGNLNQSLAETSRLSRQAAIDGVDWAKAIDQSAAETNRLFGGIIDGATEASRILSEMGIDPKKIKDPLYDIQQAFSDLVNTGIQEGPLLFAAFEKGLNASKNIEDINLIGASLATAFANGQISAELFAKGVDELATKQDKLTGSTDATKKALAAQAKEAERAEEAAAKLSLELEKLASNERIKTLEFKANIDVARIQADAQKVTAAFESISNTISETSQNVRDLFGIFAANAGTLTFAQLRTIEDQIAVENKLRQDAFDLQKRLTNAQIDAMQATTRALVSGDALIKIDGAGLQPQLEAFMWEILKAIQVRVNRDGLKLLLGV